MSTLTLARHGESLWNLENRFTGWIDIDLSSRGTDEARDLGEKRCSRCLWWQDERSVLTLGRSECHAAYVISLVPTTGISRKQYL